jgi:hypothetical protein
MRKKVQVLPTASTEMKGPCDWVSSAVPNEGLQAYLDTPKK